MNFWAEYFSAKGNRSGLDRLRPFTSKDCDIWVSLATLRHLETRSDQGTIIKGTSPADGQLGILTLNGPDARRVDLMTNVYGIPQTQINQVIARAMMVNGVSVMDPILLFQSKCHCLVGLDQSTRQDEKHLRILCTILPEHFREALEDTIAGRATERALIKELKLLQSVLSLQRVKRALDAIGVAVIGLVPVDDLRACSLEKVRSFAERSLDD